MPFPFRFKMYNIPVLDYDVEALDSFYFKSRAGETFETRARFPFVRLEMRFLLSMVSSLRSFKIPNLDFVLVQK